MITCVSIFQWQSKIFAKYICIKMLLVMQTKNRLNRLKWRIILVCFHWNLFLIKILLQYCFKAMTQSSHYELSIKKAPFFHVFTDKHNIHLRIEVPPPPCNFKMHWTKLQNFICRWFSLNSGMLNNNNQLLNFVTILFETHKRQTTNFVSASSFIATLAQLGHQEKSKLSQPILGYLQGI